MSHLTDAGPDALTSLVSASITGLYEGNVRYRSKPEPKAQLSTLQLLVGPHGQAAAVDAAAKGVALAQGTLMARCGQQGLGSLVVIYLACWLR